MTLAELAIKSAANSGPAVPARMIREYAPLGDRRELEPEEEEAAAAGASQWIPKIVQTDATTIPDMMSSPSRGALLSGALGAAAGGAAGAGLGRFSGHPGIGAAIGAAGVGIPAALHSYLSRHHNNDHLSETMHRLPPGATKRDFDAVELLGDALDRRYDGKAAGDKLAAPWNRAVRVRTHKRKYPAGRKKTKSGEVRGPEGEYCPHCDARCERGDEGRCNRCGKPWPEKKAARTCSCGSDMRGAWCPRCKTFDWGKKAAELSPLAIGFVARCYAAGMDTAGIKTAAEKLAATMDDVTAGELKTAAGIAGALEEGVESKIGPAIGNWGGKMFGKLFNKAAPSVEAKAPGVLSQLAKPFAGNAAARGTAAGYSAASAYMDPGAAPDGNPLHNLTDPKRLGIAAGAGLAGAAAPATAMRGVTGHTAGEMIDYSSQFLGGPDTKLRYGLAGTNMARPLIRQGIGAATEQMPAAAKPLNAAGDFLDGIGSKPSYGSSGMNPFSVGKSIVDDHGVPIPAQAASTAYQAGRGVNKVLGFPMHMFDAGVGAAKNTGKAMFSTPLRAGISGGALATTGIAGGAALGYGKMMDSVQQHAAAGATAAVNQQIGITPEMQQQLGNVDKLVQGVQANDPDAIKQLQQYGLGQTPNGFDPKQAVQQLQGMQTTMRSQAVMDHFGIPQALPNMVKQYADSPDFNNLVKQKTGFSVDDIKSYGPKIHEMLSAGGSGAAAALHSISGLADSILGLIPGLNVGGMTPIQKAMLLFGGLGLLGGAMGGSGLVATLGGLAMAGGIGSTMMQHPAQQQSAAPGQAGQAPAAAPAAPQQPMPAPVQAPAPTTRPMGGQDVLDDQAHR